MNVEQAMQLKDGNRVHVNYKGTPGYTGHIKEYGRVQGLPGPIVHKNIHGVEFVTVCVYLPSQKHASVFPSHCLS